MVNWGKQSAFDMFSNLMTFQALASQQGQANPAVAPVIPSAGVTLTITVHCLLECSLSLKRSPDYQQIKETSSVSSEFAVNLLLGAAGLVEALSLSDI